LSEGDSFLSGIGGGGKAFFFGTGDGDNEIKSSSKSFSVAIGGGGNVFLIGDIDSISESGAGTTGAGVVFLIGVAGDDSALGGNGAAVFLTGVFTGVAGAVSGFGGVDGLIGVALRYIGVEGLDGTAGGGGNFFLCGTGDSVAEFGFDELGVVGFAGSAGGLTFGNGFGLIGISRSKLESDIALSIS